MTRMKGSLHEDRCTFMAISRSIILGIRDISDKCYRAAFLKLWSADHKWSSGSALVVLLD